VPSIEAAREEGVIVIALDTPTDPQDATDALFATDNFQAGVLIGEYARAALDTPDEAKIALLNLLPGITVGDLRRDGFLEGFGIGLDSEQVVCQQDTQGDQALGQTAMENCIVLDPEINLVYTINEPAAFGAYTALENAGLEDEVTIVSVDGGCAGVEGVIDGRIAAVCRARWNSFALIVPKFVIEELQNVADSSDIHRRERGRSGIDTLNALREMAHLDLRIHDSDVDHESKVDAKLIFLAKSLKAKLLTTDYNLGRLAEFNGIEWLNLNELSKAVNPELRIGLAIEVELVKPGKEPQQAIGYLPDGSMVVVNNGKKHIGREVGVEVTGIVPTSGGRMVFSELVS